MWKEKPVIATITKYSLLGISMLIYHSIDYNEPFGKVLITCAIGVAFAISSCVIMPKQSDTYTRGNIYATLLVMFFAIVCYKTKGTMYVFRFLRFVISIANPLNVIGIIYSWIQQLRDWFHRK